MKKRTDYSSYQKGRGFSEKKDILCAEDIPLPILAAEYGTPAYIYSASAIKGSVEHFTTILNRHLSQPPLVAFACKANSNLAILRLLAQLGLGADIVSGGELARALKAGIPAEKIVFSGVSKTAKEIRAGLTAGILQFNLETEDEMARIAAIAKELNLVAPVSFRLNPDVDAKTHAKITTGKTDNKFGLPAFTIEKLYHQAVQDPNLKPRGLSVHIGSQMIDLKPFAQACQKTAELAQRLLKENLPVPALDLGGGLGIPYAEDEPGPDIEAYAAIVADTVGPLGLDLIFEPGRYLVGAAGILLATVTDIKASVQNDFVILDAGLNDLIRPSLYNALHQIIPVDSGGNRALYTYHIVGPVCETGDTFAINYTLPAIKPGDLLAILSSGAYGFSMASNYNARPRPPEIMVEKTKHALIRKRETIAEMMKADIIPEWL